MVYDPNIDFKLAPDQFNSVVMELLIALKIEVEFVQIQLRKMITESSGDVEQTLRDLETHWERFSKERKAAILAKIIKDYWTPETKEFGSGLDSEDNGIQFPRHQSN